MPITINGIPQTPGSMVREPEQYSIKNTRDNLTRLAAMKAVKDFVGTAKKLYFRVDDLDPRAYDGFDRGTVVYRNGAGDPISCQWSTDNLANFRVISHTPDSYFKVTSANFTSLDPNLARTVVAVCSYATAELETQAAITEDIDS